jgi:hypothetical protein
MATMITVQTDDLSLATKLLELVKEPQEPEEPAESPILGFLNSLPPSCHTFVMQVALASRGGNEKRRSDLQKLIKINGEAIGNDDTRFNGVTGSVGRAWHRFFPNRLNPFTGRPDGNDVVYLVSQALAGELWATYLFGGGKIPSEDEEFVREHENDGSTARAEN